MSQRQKTLRVSFPFQRLLWLSAFVLSTGEDESEVMSLVCIYVSLNAEMVTLAMSGCLEKRGDFPDHMEAVPTTTLAGLQIMIMMDFVDKTFLRVTVKSLLSRFHSDLKWARVSV